jgi:hypothetical protein
MVIAWTQLLHSLLGRAGQDIVIRSSDGEPVTSGRGKQPKLWDISHCIEYCYQSQADPIRCNLEFFVELRHVIEHRYARDLEPIVAGKCQALILNYETALVSEYGTKFSLQDSLRFPIFLSSLNDEAVSAFKACYSRLPRPLRGFLETYDAGLPAETRQSSAFDFKILLIERTATLTQSDLAVEFVRADSLDEELRNRFAEALVIVRDRLVPVANADVYRPLAVVEQVSKEIPWFDVTRHTDAWHFFEVRPRPGSANPEKTDQKYCLWDEAHRDYVYTNAWVRKLVREFKGGASRYVEICGRPAPSAWYPPAIT